MIEQELDKPDEIKVLVATDIFGETESLSLMLEQLGGRDRFQVVSPYPQSSSNMTDETQAYQRYQEQGGLDAYISNLKEQLAKHKNIHILIGFSAGAAALYQAVSSLPHIIHNKMVLFYPGQIRHMLSLQIETPCHIIFPCEEKHFDLAEIIDVLNTKRHLSVEQTKYHHGFMNTLSKNFSQVAYQEYCRYLCKFLV